MDWTTSLYHALSPLGGIFFALNRSDWVVIKRNTRHTQTWSLYLLQDLLQIIKDWRSPDLMDKEGI
jgi:hypothetical protein